MITPTNGPDKAQGLQILKIHKVNATSGVSRRDDVTISNFSTLVKHARTCAMALPDVRADVVARARQAIDNGNLPGSGDIASRMINRSVEGQV
ncbi:MAG: flagellar biosynthesis anti-sigma factor FlgM [Armatimonadota bacterium]|jgi:anti-sigma28 factor (negative regulator of flagellin synthesis)|nr:flagellar biosynthesis anti-sigma factor FlgM [bacterium]